MRAEFSRRTPTATTPIRSRRKAPTSVSMPRRRTSIGVSATRNLSEFITSEEWAEVVQRCLQFRSERVAGEGHAVKWSRPTACNRCHDPLIGHGGSRLTVELCILCHTPQTINPDTNLTQDMKVLIHKIHMGKNLPSVKAGTPYRIWHRGAWSDFSDVGFPSGTDELRRARSATRRRRRRTMP